MEFPAPSCQVPLAHGAGSLCRAAVQSASARGSTETSGSRSAASAIPMLCDPVGSVAVKLLEATTSGMRRLRARISERVATASRVSEKKSMSKSMIHSVPAQRLDIDTTLRGAWVTETEATSPFRPSAAQARIARYDHKVERPQPPATEAGRAPCLRRALAARIRRAREFSWH